GHHILRAEGPGGQKQGQGRINPAGKPENHLLEAGLLHLFPEGANQQFHGQLLIQSQIGRPGKHLFHRIHGSSPPSDRRFRIRSISRAVSSRSSSRSIGIWERARRTSSGFTSITTRRDSNRSPRTRNRPKGSNAADPPKK